MVQLGRWVTVLGLLALFLVLAGRFAGVQAIWVDETTQLSGLALSPSEQLEWLLGRSDIQLGVPPDRMPPLSYWLGGLWAGHFGVSEHAMRWFGILSVLCAAPAFYLAGQLVSGWRAGLFCLAFILLSPTVFIQSVEIRAYPLFLTFSSWATYFYIRLTMRQGTSPDPIKKVDWRSMLALAACVTAAVYTHFYGLIFGACLLVGLIAGTLRAHRPLGPILCLGAATAIVCLGVFPFVLAAMQVSPSGAGDSSNLPLAAHLKEVGADTVRLAFRLFAHGSHLVYPLSLGIVLIGVLGLAALALTRPVGDNHGLARLDPLVPVLVAFPLLVGLSLSVSSFDVLAPHYNLWMIPMTALWLSSALSVTSKTWRSNLVTVFATLAILGQIMAAAIVWRHGPFFAHGPGEWIAAQISLPDATLIIHDGDGPWGQAYFPVYYLTQGVVTQVVARPDQSLARITPTGLREIDDAQADFFAQFEEIYVVSVRKRSSQFLAQRIRADETCGGGPATSVHGLGASAASASYCAFTAATIWHHKG